MPETADTRDVVVVGCGVIGLSSAIRLLEDGHRVRIVARELPPNTTSDRAAAIWYPYHARPFDRVLAWSRVAYEEFSRLAGVPASGVSMTTLTEALDGPAPDPWWKDAVPGFRRASRDELPDGYLDGYVIDVPVIDTRIYLPYLLDRLTQLGGDVEQREVEDLGALNRPGRIIVNSTGLGARDLLGDRAVYPIRGQFIRVKAPGVRRATAALREHPTYVIPRTDDVILGGTAQDHDWNPNVDRQTAEEILERCRSVEPALDGVEVVSHDVGLRPGRPEVRLEVERLDGAPIIHNYGHGGAGFTLSWGCAAEVAVAAMESTGIG